MGSYDKRCITLAGNTLGPFIFLLHIHYKISYHQKMQTSHSQKTEMEVIIVDRNRMFFTVMQISALIRSIGSYDRITLDRKAIAKGRIKELFLESAKCESPGI